MTTYINIILLIATTIIILSIDIAIIEKVTKDIEGIYKFTGRRIAPIIILIFIMFLLSIVSIIAVLSLILL